MSKKIFGLVALFAAVALFAGANTVKAATAEELQAQINMLLAQIGSLQGGSSTSCYSFTRDLTVGAQGADVTALQNYLAAKGYFNVAATGYFGSITASAVASWQSANGVMPAAGYFGAISRAKYNSMCSSTPTTPTPGDDDDDDDDDDDFGGSNGEEASLEDYDAQDGDDTDAEEGASEQSIMEFEFDVEDSDVEVQRVEVTFSPDSANDEMDPWDVFEGATLWMDGDEVASIEDLDDEDNWDEESGDDYSFRFNGVDTVIDMGEKAEFTLTVDLQDGIDGVSGDASWNVFIDDEGIRALDEAGIDQYIGDDSDTVTVDIEEAGEDNELSLSESDDNEDAMTLEVDEDDKSDWQSLGLMTLSADGDIELRDFKFQLLVNEGVSPADEVYNDVVNDLMIVIDGEEYDDFSVANASTATATLTFDLDDEDIVIEDGDEVEVEVMAEFKALTGNYDEGTTVTVNASSGLFETIDAEGAEDGEDLGADQLEGSFEGETNTLRSQGFSVDFVDASETSPVGSVESRADYEIEFTVTAFGDDFFIPRTTTRDDSASSTVGITYVIEEDDGDEYTSGTTSASFSTTNSVSGDSSSYFKVSEGQTRTFRLAVTLNNLGATSGYYSLQMAGIAFDTDTTAGGTETVDGDELDEFDTDTVQVQNANVD